MNYYKLSIYMQIEYEHTKNEVYFFRTAQEAEDFKKEYDKVYRVEDGSYNSSIDFIEYEIDEVSYDKLKERITVSEFEKMFDIVL